MREKAEAGVMQTRPSISGRVDGLMGGWEEISRYHWLVFIGCWIGGIFDGMDATLMSVAMPAALGELLGSADKAVIAPVASWVSAVFLLGWMVGGVVFGILGDTLGRVKSMMLSILLYAMFTGLAGFAHHWHQLAACRFLTGLGIGGELVTIATFLSEVWPSRSRAVAIGALITSYQAGVFLAGNINTWVADWRTTFFIGVLPAFLVIFLRAALKESGPWMEARMQKESVSHWRRLFTRAHARALVVGSVIFGGLLMGYWASLSWVPLWIQDMLKTNGAERGIATMCQGIAAVCGCCLAGVFADRLGRRATILFSYLGCFGASALLFLTNTVFSPLIYWESALLGFFIGMAQAVMFIYLPELFPTLIRASGTGFCLNAGRLVTVFAVFFVGDLVQLAVTHQLPQRLFGQTDMSAYALVAFLFAFAYLIAVIAACFGTETKGRPLPD